MALGVTFLYEKVATKNNTRTHCFLPHVFDTLEKSATTNAHGRGGRKIQQKVKCSKPLREEYYQSQTQLFHFHTFFCNNVQYQRWIFQKTINVSTSLQTTEQQPFHFLYVYEWYIFITAQFLEQGVLSAIVYFEAPILKLK